MRCATRVRWGLLVGLLLCLSFARADGADVPSISVAELPPEGRVTLQRIQQGGPFSYPRDGVVFGNYEHRLPQQPRGHYREYTVPTPGVRHRGARRIVCGIVPVECYYSADHYRTFRRIRE
ncbi:ribonuclease domain-containing protein [Ferrigenium sp. UT5]|uniref:ribonuclease domain-containing protein n=1 Tax=Ferrigenium sp. UT5 TaxID=3242105 RepID=UPI0035535294